MVTVHLICFQFHTGNSAFSFLCNIERNAVVVVRYALLTARIVHQIIKDSHIDTGKILVNLKSTLWRVLVYGVQANTLTVKENSEENIVNVLYVSAGNKIVNLYAGESTVEHDGQEHTVKDVTIKENGCDDIAVEDSAATKSHELNDRKRDKNVVENITAQRTESLPGIYSVAFSAKSYVRNSKGVTLGNYTVIQHPGKLTITYQPSAAVCTYDFGVTNSYNVLNDVEKAAASITVPEAYQSYVTIDDEKNIIYTPQSLNTGEKGQWTTDGTSAATTVSDNETTVYGYTEAYDSFNQFSNGSALKATLNLNGGKSAYTNDAVTFTFTGTGFDLISECGTDTGMLVVGLKGTGVDGTKHAYVVDTYFCGDEDGIISGSGLLDYQVPVVRKLDLPYDTYTVTVYGYLTNGSGASTASTAASSRQNSLMTAAAYDLATDQEVDVSSILQDLGMEEYLSGEVTVSFMDENSVLNGEACFRLPPEVSARVRWQSECENLSRDHLLRRAEAIARDREIPILPSECQEMPTEHIRCRAGAASFWITYHGQMRPCGMMKMPSVPVGEDFRTAWDQIRSQREKIMVPALCTACRYRTICEACPTVCMAETGEFASVPTYLCRKMEAYAALAAHWYEEIREEGAGEGAEDGFGEETKEGLGEDREERAGEGTEGPTRENTGMIQERAYEGKR